MRLLVAAKSGFPASSLPAGRDGIMITNATSAEEAIALLRREPHDLALLDMRPAVREALDFILQVRTSQSDIPILAVMGERAGDRTAALALGADDAIPTLADPEELYARCASLLRRRRRVSESPLIFGNVTLCRISRDALVGGRPVKLTSLEYALLEYLALRKDRAIGKDALLAHLYDGAEQPEIKVIDVFICKARSKLQRAGADPLITTVWGQGYTINNQQSAGRYPVNDQDHQQVA